MTRTELLSFIMHSIGLPLIHATIKTSHKEDEEGAIEEITSLLTQTIQNSEQIKATLDLNKKDTLDKEFRLHLMSFSSKIIAAHYEKTRALPTEKGLKHSLTTINALLTFSEKYLPLNRLTELYPENPQISKTLEKHVTNLTYLENFVPLVNAVATFSFGLSEVKMIQDVSEKLRSKAAQIHTDFLGSKLPDNDRKADELSILKTLIELYASCHMQEIDRIMTLDDTTRNSRNSHEQINDIWMLFEKRVALLTSLAHNLLPDEDIQDIDRIFNEVESPAQNIEETEEEKFGPMAFYKKK